MRVLIADDEPLLLAALREQVQRLWPEAQVVAEASDGESALKLCLKHTPELVLLDIRMPAMNGLQVAHSLEESWPASLAFPDIAYITAYDEYAVQAFRVGALDYLLKPVTDEQLIALYERVKRRHSVQGQPMVPSAAQTATSSLSQLKQLQIGVGKQIVIVPLAEVVLLEAADKYVRVVTNQGRELLMRTPLKDLLPQLDCDEFWQVHRGTVVRVSTIEAATRDENGGLSLQLRGISEKPKVSRVFAARFRAM